MNIGSNIEITNENCMDLMARYPDGYFDLAIVDPPYFSGPEKRRYYGKKISSHGVKRVKYPVLNNWTVPKAKYFIELFRVSKQQIIWGCNYFDFDFGFGRIVWDKVNQANDFSDCEIAYCSIHDSVRLFRFMWNGMLQGKGVFTGHIMQGDKAKNEKRIHPTQKPVKLYSWIINRYAKKGFKILDTHLGSGSIAIAIDQANRIDGMELEFTGCDLEEVYYQAATKRIREHMAQQVIFE